MGVPGGEVKGVGEADGWRVGRGGGPGEKESRICVLVDLSGRPWK